MIFTILLWTGMTGMTGHGEKCCMHGFAHNRPNATELSVTCSGFCPLEHCSDDTGRKWIETCKQFPSVKWQATGDSTTALRTAEHVFEIRTHKREVEYWLPAANPTDGDYIIGFAGQCIRDGDKWSAEKRACGIRRRTHELWLDGKRLGTLKYTEEK